jgi:hypothetical protein
MGERMDVINVDSGTATARSTHTEFSLAVALPRLHQRQIVLQGFRMLTQIYMNVMQKPGLEVKSPLDGLLTEV